MTLDERVTILRHQTAPPIDITAMATDLGLAIYDDELLPNGVSGSIRKENAAGASFRVNVNPDDSYRRQRFTIAHECAHYLLHREKIGDGLSDDAMYRSDKMTTAEEFEANNLAAELLMPKSLVLKYYEAGDSTYTAMADLFDVSEAAMRVRLRYLLYLR